MIISGLHSALRLWQALPWTSCDISLTIWLFPTACGSCHYFKLERCLLGSIKLASRSGSWISPSESKSSPNLPETGQVITCVSPLHTGGLRSHLPSLCVAFWKTAYAFNHSQEPCCNTIKCWKAFADCETSIDVATPGNACRAVNSSKKSMSHSAQASVLCLGTSGWRDWV